MRLPGALDRYNARYIEKLRSRRAPDQSVNFARLKDGKLFVNATFTVGVWKGELADAEVQPVVHSSAFMVFFQPATRVVRAIFC